MSEKLYSRLFRLFPSHFRNTHGDEALQLFRDRARDETGFFPRVRLWFDLIIDLTISVPREYGRSGTVLTPATVQVLDGVPTFALLTEEHLSFGPLSLGGTLALLMLAAFPIVFNVPKNDPAMSAGVLSHSQNHSGIHQRGSSQSAAQQATNGIAGGSWKSDPAELRHVLDATVVNLKEHYVDTDVARKLTDVLRTHEQRGDYDGLPDGARFADLVTKDMRAVSHDTHLELVYSEAPLPPQPTEPTTEEVAGYRAEMKRENCTFEKVEILPHNIGYLKLNSFPEPAACESTARAAMARLNGADAVIFDLRDNHGGDGEMTSLIASYLFDHPEYWYNPRKATTEESWTRSPVPENRLADKPVYILTSTRTISAAEQFCYDLRMLKRATLVGETTRGATHAGVWHRIDDHFGIAISETKPINPFSNADWEGVGVEPDVKADAPDALKAAEKLAEARRGNK